MPNLVAFTDGACRGGNPGMCSSAFVVYKDGTEYHKQGRVLEGTHSNNESEYQALLDLLDFLYANSLRNVIVYSDSELVCKQVNQVYRTESDELRLLMVKAYGLLTRGCHVLKHVKGHSGIEGNEAADKLCNEVLDATKI